MYELHRNKGGSTVDREQLDALLKEADDLYAQGNLNTALDAYQDVLSIDSSCAWAYSRIGAIRAQQGDTDGAEEALKKAIELDPTLPQAHSNLGNIYYARGEYEVALAKYKEAVALSPNTPVFHENLHAAYKKLGKVTDAVSALKQAHRLEREVTKTEAKAKFAGMKQAAKGRFGCLGILALLVLVGGTLWVL